MFNNFRILFLLLLSANILFAQDSTQVESADTLATAKDDTTLAKAMVAVDSIDAPKAKETVLKDSMLAGLSTITILNKSTLTGVLSKANSPYLIVGVVQVPAGEELVVEEGVEVHFSPQRKSGLQVFGSLKVSGTAAEPVRFSSMSNNPTAGDWDRIQITGNKPSELNFVEISHGDVSLHIENSSLVLNNVKINNSASRAIYARNSQLEINSGEISHNKDLAIHLANSSYFRAQKLNLHHNNTAIAAMDHSFMSLLGSNITDNNNALFLLPQAHYELANNKIEQNKVAVVSPSGFAPEYRKGIKNNGQNLQRIPEAIAQNRFPEVNLYSDFLLYEAVHGGDTVATEEETWNLYGNIGYGGGYSKVITKKNRSGEPQSSLRGIVATGEKYPNIFAPESFFADAYAYMFLESSAGRSIEFQGEMESNRWNYFRAHPVFARYSSDLQSLTLGDFNASLSPIFVDGFNVLGANYQLDLKVGERSNSFFGLQAFVGESQKPLALDARHPDIFGQYTEEGQAIPQELSAMGSVYLRPLNNTKMQVGALFAERKREDLLVRYDIGKVQTAEPVVDANNYFASLNWHNALESFGVRADMAVGKADTAQALTQKIMDEIFMREGLRTVSLVANPWLEQGSYAIRSASNDQIYEIFNRNISLSKAQDSLIVLMKEVKKKQAAAWKEIEADRTGGVNWSKEHLAARLSLDWKLSWLDLNFYGQYSGLNYMSPGANSLLQNSREYGVLGFLNPWESWQISVDYMALAENASAESSTNFFGLYEGSLLGLDPNEDWEKKHIMDENRLRFSHDFNMNNSFNLSEKLNMDLSYGFFKTSQNQPRTLNITEKFPELILIDPWFAPRKDKKTTKYIIEEKEHELDLDRVNELESVISTHGLDLAQGYREDYHIHRIAAGIQWHKKNFIWRLGAETRLSFESSDFEQKVLYDYDWQDSTLAKLAWFPHGNSWVEYSYPMSLSTVVAGLTNHLSFTPRWRHFDTQGEEEREWNLSNNLELKITPRYTALSDLYWVRSKQKYQQLEEFEHQNLDLSLGLRVNWKWNFYSEFMLVGSRVWHSDNPQNEYRSGLAKISFHHIF